MSWLDEDAGDGFTNRRNLISKIMLAFAAGSLSGALVTGLVLLARGLAQTMGSPS